LVDPASGALAKVLPEVGFNCFSYAPIIDGEPVEVLWSAPGVETGDVRPMASGIPILFPYAGRLRGTTLQFGDQDWPLVIDDRPLPFSLGTHGYFRLPLGDFGKRDECQILVPAASYWELEGMLPTGRKLPATGPRGVSGGMAFGQSQLDDIFTDLSARKGRVV